MSAPSELVRPRPERAQRVPRVLVVDDELFVVQALRLVLAREFDVTGTTRPEQALEWLADGESFDVILCDVMMPGMGGIALRDRIAADHPEHAARVVFITGGLLLPDVRAALEGVSNPVLEKPIDLENLRELIRRRVRRAWQTADCAI
jgi:CheY-like chemotaxis protein